jgi:hypothetical protein
MAEYIINDGKVVNVDENNWPSIVSKVEITDGILNFLNNSDEIKLLKFDEIKAVIKSFGQMNVKGKLVEVYQSNGELGQSFSLPIENHSIGGIFVEKEPGGELELWRCINFGSMSHEFDDFAKDNVIGNVYKIADGKITFTDNKDYSNVPGKDCKVFIPNIIISTKDGDNNNKHARIDNDNGGNISFDTVAFSNFYGSYSGMSNIKFKDTLFGYPLNISYVNSININNILVSNNTSYATGITMAYCQDVQLKNIVSQSTKSYGVNISYSKGVSVDNVFGLLVSRDSNTDAAIYFYTVQGLECGKLYPLGGMALFKNTNNTNINYISCVNNLKKELTSSYSQPNVKIQDSSGVVINEVEIVDNGSSYDSFVNVVNSSNVKVLKLTTNENYANYAVRCDVVYDSVFANFSFGGTRSNNTIRLDNKSNNVLIQKFISNELQTYKIGAKNSTLKGVYSDQIEFDDGAYNSIGHQLYTSSDEGAIDILFTKNNFYKIINGKPRFSYGNSINVKKDDEIVVRFPFLLRGVQLLEKEPVVNGKDIDDLRIFVKAKTKEITTDYMLLKKENLSKIQDKIGDNGFELFIKFDGVNLDEYTTAVVKEIKLYTNDSRFDYPLDFKKITIMLDKMIQSDKKAVFALMYKKTYLNNEAVIVEDKNGYPIYGRVGGKSVLEFDYDYKYNNQANRTPNEPFEVVLVVNSPSFSEPIVIESKIDKDIDSAFNVTSIKDKAFELAEFVLQQNKDDEEQ